MTLVEALARIMCGEDAPPVIWMTPQMIEQFGGRAAVGQWCRELGASLHVTEPFMPMLDVKCDAVHHSPAPGPV